MKTNALRQTSRLPAILLLWALAAATCLRAQPTPLAGAAELQETLDRLNTLGSLLIIGAHPDDENTAVIAYFACGRHIRTAYLSATRGEGGQNLLGPEQAELLGVIRTQELLAARQIDGGEQFFTRAIDFGYSKSPKEALAKWGRERVLGDMVRVIRRLRPDVIVSRFGPDRSGGHGHHNAMGLLAPEAFEAAGDPGRFPEQIQQGLEPWKARRLYWNTYSFTPELEAAELRRDDRLRIDTGEYDPLLGKSYAEVAGESRSMHRSQAMGTGQRKGSAPAFFAYLAGDRAEQDLFEGIDASWRRVPGGVPVGRLLAQARSEYRPQQPEAILPLLVQAYAGLEKLDHDWARWKQGEVLRAIELAAGLWIDAAGENWYATPGSELEVTISALNRSRFPLTWLRTEIVGVVSKSDDGPAVSLAYNQTSEKTLVVSVPRNAPYSQPEWLRKSEQGEFYDVRDPSIIGNAESRPVLEAIFYLKTGDGVELPIRKPVVYRWVDRALGERTRSLEIVPPVAVSFSQPTAIFPDAKPREVSVQLTGHAMKVAGAASLEVPNGWQATPASIPFEMARPGRYIALSFEVRPPPGESGGSVVAKVQLGETVISTGIQTIEYPHIPIQVVYPPAKLRVERADIKILSKKIGYVMGAGDDVPQALEQIGATVTLLSSKELAAGDLSQFDAVVTGVRALNTRPDLLAARDRLLQYVADGGTLVVQYNTASHRLESTPLLSPYPLTPSSNRVSVEDASVHFVNPDHPLLQAPNRITLRDFKGWVQERGLYFMSAWDKRYEPILESTDPGEPPQRGGLLYARYGRGVYIFTGYSWFRQLPTGVPGAYRIFANLVSAGKVR